MSLNNKLYPSATFLPAVEGTGTFNRKGLLLTGGLFIASKVNNGNGLVHQHFSPKSYNYQISDLDILTILLPKNSFIILGFFDWRMFLVSIRNSLKTYKWNNALDVNINFKF